MPVEKICENCAKTFSVKPHDASRRFCSWDCKKAHQEANNIVSMKCDVAVFQCKECGNKFPMMPSYFRAYRKKFGKDPMYCSIKCSALGRRKDADERSKFTCEHCGNEATKKRKYSGQIYQQQKYCSDECAAEGRKKKFADRGEDMKVTKRIKRGYVILHIPRRSGEEPYDILEHRYNMEQKIGRKLRPSETVHHKNGNRQDNSDDNLELWSSLHGPGQRVTDKVAFAIEMLTLYPEFAKAAGVEMRHL